MTLQNQNVGTGEGKSVWSGREVDYDTFLNWVSERLGEYREAGDEIKVNSVFTDDHKFHLWCCPAKNAFHCWKSDRGGSLVDLVAEVDRVDRRTAAAALGLGNKVRTLDADVERFMAEQYPVAPPPPPPDVVPLPPFTMPITRLPDDSPSKRPFVEYLAGRSIPPDGLYACTGGKYRDRVIIPYRGPAGEIRYWNGRDITGRHGLRYWGPTREECGVGKGDVVYFYQWPSPGATVDVTEGELDAASLTLSGLCGAAVGGKEIDDKQIEILRPYRIRLAFDGDPAGLRAVRDMGHKLLRSGMRPTLVAPPLGYKDWNKLLTERGRQVIKEYIEANTMPYDQVSVWG